ncbi:hypothetical protein [Legionella brunensis]|uniref:Uncharacterized protein n=1 Tax=Legionella brunensis TaxID=29422 RepID=A0A0W0SQG3_9GAMM|nr:hypothetical protein [Legionella brunensis]KTC85237.1 hypothetical protein Lbru_1033 [Legionella brunensis]
MLFNSLTADNFELFLKERLKERKITYKPEKIKEIWTKLSDELGDKIEKGHINEFSFKELKEFGLGSALIQELLSWSKEASPSSAGNLGFDTSLHMMEQSEEEIDLPFSTSEPGGVRDEENEFLAEPPFISSMNTRETSNIEWIYRRKGNKSRAEWKNYDNRGSRSQSLEYWRTEFQRCETQAPLKLVKNCSHPFPRVCLRDYPEASTVKITIKGSNLKDLLEGNEASVIKGEADFVDFKIRKSSYSETEKKHQEWILQFKVYNADNQLLLTLETAGIQVVAMSKQLEQDQHKLSSVQTEFGIQISDLNRINFPHGKEDAVFHQNQVRRSMNLYKIETDFLIKSEQAIAGDKILSMFDEAYGNFLKNVSLEGREAALNIATDPIKRNEFIQKMGDYNLLFNSVNAVDTGTQQNQFFSLYDDLLNVPLSSPYAFFPPAPSSTEQPSAKTTKKRSLPDGNTEEEGHSKHSKHN